MISTEVVLLILGTIFTSSTQQPFIRQVRPNKGLNGIVPSSDVVAIGLVRVVYHHDQTVAIVDINKRREIRNCNIIEGYEPQEVREIFQNLSKLVSKEEVSFSDMTLLMSRCEQLDRVQQNERELSTPTKSPLEQANAIGANALNLLSGILPGTKWCGTGDVAENYHDLGPETDIDRCCRTHDLCPIKIRAQRTRYNLTNNALYSKSHCACDSALYHCLKEVASPTAQIMGKLYFNIVKVECIDDVSSSMKKFSRTRLKF